MSERALRFRLGLFVLIALVLLAAMILMFGSVNLASWFRRTNDYTIVFPDAPGVSPGTPVRRSGVRIGDVTDVTLDDETGQVNVRIAIDRKFTIRHHEKPTLIVSVLGGDAMIDFIAQKQEPNQPALDRSSVPSGETLAGVTQPTVGTILSRANEAQELMNDIRKSLQNLEKISPAVEETLKEYRELAREARGFLPELKNTNKEAQVFLRSAQEVMPDAKKAAEEIRKLATALNGGEVPREEASGSPPRSDPSQQFVSAALPVVQKEENTSLPKLVRQANEVMPEVKKFIASANEVMPELKKLIVSTNDLMPDVKTTVRDIGAAAQQYNKLGESLDRFVKENQPKLARIIDNVNATLDRTLDLLSNENRRNITDTIRNIRNTSDRLPEMTKNLDEALKEGRDTAKRLRQSMDKADEVITNLRDATKPLGERGPSLVRNLDESLDKMNKVLGDLRELLRVVGESDGTLRRFLNDPALYNHLDDTVTAVGKMMPRLDRILKDFETFADKLARHPEAIGLGGVVKPGSGVKDPPAPYPGYVVPPR